MATARVIDILQAQAAFYDGSCGTRTSSKLCCKTKFSCFKLASSSPRPLTSWLIKEVQLKRGSGTRKNDALSAHILAFAHLYDRRLVAEHAKFRAECFHLFLPRLTLGCRERISPQAGLPKSCFASKRASAVGCRLRSQGSSDRLFWSPGTLLSPACSTLLTPTNTPGALRATKVRDV